MLETTEAPPPPAATPSVVPRRRPAPVHRHLRWPLAILPWIFPAVLLVLALLNTGVSGRDIALYAFYFAIDIVLPGTLVYRLLRGSRGNVPEDLGLGAATGMLLMLGGWALCAFLGTQVLLPWWPALIVVPFLAVPRLHRHWRVSRPRPLPLRWSWIVAGGLVLLVGSEYPGWTTTPLPPAGGVIYQDLWYHLALVHEMMRSMPFQVPQMAGDSLTYHYLSDADIATASMVTKIDPAVVMLRLWIVPVAGTAVLVMAALARTLSGKWWAGALGGTTAILGLPLLLGAATTALGVNPVSPYSPSQTYAVPLLGLLVVLTVDVLRGRGLGWAWLLIFPLALACAGAKSSALPPFLAGLLAAAVIVAFRHRRRLLPTAALFALTIGAVVLGFRLFAGGGAGTLGFQPLAILFWVVPYRQTIGYQDVIDKNIFLPYGVEHTGTAGRAFIAGVLIWWLLMQAPRMLALAGIVARPTRTEPAMWLLAGMTAAGAGATFLLWHPSASQIYFYMGAAPFGTVAVAWLMAATARSWRPVLAGVLAGGIWALIAPQMFPPRVDRVVRWALVLAEPIVRTAVIAVGVAAIALILRRVFTGRTPWQALPAGILAAVLGAGLIGGAQRQIQEVDAALSAVPTPSEEDPGKVILPEEMLAAEWLDDHAGRDDVVATNVHCTPIDWTSGCDARAFWVAGLGGRRTVIESWGYTDAAVAEDGVNGERYMRQPAPDFERYQLNQKVFADGQEADLAELKRLYNVRWLFADDRAAGVVSSNLAQIAKVRFTSGPVTIYELP
ncbi:hypothetical protein JIG36_21460 [Actinoplanes sp. LDG1-06]|uniref:Uncharacterized protein n=1 Tax=Paractinoplanes ovalisporus TaxID=2810368 RepID=A0ABS2AE90_9ACTN|nr:hypothetical protein [Actinoplanes ovalisporus]MBM2618129.1 hypothetical protein [Actinoplanes ovalisporus]